MTTTPKTPPGFSADRPIASKSEDLLGRGAFAEAIADQIDAAPREAASVFGLCGPWGSGKTSVLHMLEEALSHRRNITVLRFNPWLFSGTEQLVSQFFEQIALQLGETSDAKMRALGQRLQRYAKFASPLRYFPGAPGWLGRIADAGRAVGDALAAPASLQKQRAELDALLRASANRLVIVIDDLDRLRPDEVRDIARLVRMTADFPNTAYVLAFDRRRVEKALDADDPLGGRAYLEKILQVSYDLPTLRRSDLASLLTSDLDALLPTLPCGPFSRADWENVLLLGMLPLFSTLRDVKRFLNAIPAAIKTLRDEIALADLLALEAIRLFLPDVFDHFATSSEALTATRGELSSEPESTIATRRKTLEALLDAAGRHKDATQELITQLFPCTRAYLANTHYSHDWLKDWRKARRVAHPDILRLYLEKTLPPGILPARTVEEVFATLGDEDALRKLVDAMSADTFEHLLERLEDYEGDVPPEHVEAAARVFLGQEHRLRKGTQSFLDPGADVKLYVTVYRLIRRIDDPSRRTAIVERLTEAAPSLSARWSLVMFVGREKDVGRHLVSEDASEALETKLRQAAYGIDITSLVSERDLNRLLRWIAQSGGTTGTEWVRKVADDDAVFAAILRNGLWNSEVLVSGEAARRTSVQFSWPFLAEFLGEDFLKARVHALASAVAGTDPDDELKKALELAQQHI